MSALLLARLGWRTALLERGGRGRAKACGQCLSGWILKALDRRGLGDDIRSLSMGATRRIRVHIPGCRPVSASLVDGPDGDAGMIVKRRALDQRLIDRAGESGVDVRYRASARIESGFGVDDADDADDANDAVEVVVPARGLRLRSALVVGADGLASGVAQAAGLASRRSHGRAFGFAFDLQSAQEGAIRRETIEMFVIRGGYLGVVNCGAGLLHIAGLVRGDCQQPRSPDAFVEALAGRFALLQRVGLGRVQRMRHGPMLGAGPIPWRPQAVARGRVVLVGDAARYALPFTGAGMICALASAEVLAEVAAGRQPGSWSPDASRLYRHLWRSRIGPRVRTARLMRHLLARPRATGRLLEATGAHGRIASWLVRRVVTS